VLLHDGAVVGQVRLDAPLLHRRPGRPSGCACGAAATPRSSPARCAAGPRLVDVDLGDDDEGFEVVEPELGRAFPVDQFERDDPWVFVDFWCRFGPCYPEDVTSAVARNRPAQGLDEPHPYIPVGDAEH
jgi:hypothetical protein